MFIGIFCVLVGDAYAVEPGKVIRYEGQGAGEVVFDGTTHARKGLTCADCHEWRELLPPLFEMKKGSSDISMRKIELGTSCGYCHKVSMEDTTHCSFCHRK